MILVKKKSPSCLKCPNLNFCLQRGSALALGLDGHPGTEVRVCGASLVDAHALGNEVLALVDVLLAALVEVPQLEVLLDEVRVGALGDFVLEIACQVPLGTGGMVIWDTDVGELGALLDLLLGLDHRLLALGVQDLGL